MTAQPTLDVATTTTAEKRTPTSGAKAITEDLLARLKRHYLRPGANPPGGVFLTEVSPNGGWGTGRRCDAIFVGFTSTSGRLMIGHEIKATRADWLRELSQLHKASFWADNCHEWWVVAAPGVVKTDELPPDWGLLEPGTRTRTRMKVAVPAHRHEDLHPSWDATRSLLARLDTVQREHDHQHIQQARDDANTQHQELIDSLRAERITPEQQARLRAIDDLEERLGITIGYGTATDASPRDLPAALALIKHMDALCGHRWSALPRQIESIEQVAQSLQELHTAMEDVLGELNQADGPAREGAAHD